MSAITEPPAESFRLSQLIYDTRYRSTTIQVVAFVLIIVAIAWLGKNIVDNLRALGRDFNFSFLFERAGYDINQRLGQYTNDSVHGRAALIGMANTLLVAALGCLTATVFGVVAGVLRLSNNWIVARLMTIYVEGFRNIPLLLWILLIFAIFNESLPVPVQFRPDGGADFSFFGQVAMTRQGTFIPRLVFAEGAFLTFVVVLILSYLAVRFARNWAASYQQRTGQPIPILPISAAIYIVPLIITYFVFSGISNNRENVILAMDAQEGQSLAEYTADIRRVDLCLVPGQAGSLNMQRYAAEQEVNFRAVQGGNFNAALANFASGNCALLSVPSDEVADVMDLARGITARTVVIDERVQGVTFRPPDLDSNVSPREPAQMAVLTDRTFEGDAIEVSRPVITPRGIPRFEGGWHIRNSLIALWFALSLYTGAFIAEIVRAGILAVNRGQTEAAFALGLRPSRTMNLVILPQAMRVIIPPLISQYLNLTKNSSLAIAVSYMDFRSTLGGITINQTGRELEGMLLVGLFYLVVSLLIAAVMNVYNNSVKLQER